MPKKDNEKKVEKNVKTPVIDKKVREKLKKEIYSEINEDVKKEVAEKAMNDVEMMMDVDYKNALKERITVELIDDIKEDVKDEQKRIYRAKNFKIVRLYIYLLLLIAAAVYLIYRLYVCGDLAILDKITTKPQNTTTVVTTREVKDLAYYMSNYSSILDNVIIADASLVKSTYKIKDVSITTKLAMAFKTLNTSDIQVDGMIRKFTGDVLEKAYENVFGTKDGLVHQNFSVDGINYAYSLTDNQYVAVVYNQKEHRIVNSITNIYEENENLVVEAVSAYAVNNELFNINNTDDKVKDYIEGEDIAKYQDKFTKVKYTFKKINNKFFIDSIN